MPSSECEVCVRCRPALYLGLKDLGSKAAYAAELSQRIKAAGIPFDGLTPTDEEV